MDILEKSFFTYIDLAMDHFKTSFEVREKFLIWCSDYYEVSNDHVKKWSRVGKGIDYYTFKSWISKESRFPVTKTKIPKRSFKLESHYHPIESVLEVMNANSYEDKLKFYHTLSLLVLVDKKYILPRIEFIKWTALALELDVEDCSIIREHVVEEFDLSFDIANLEQQEKDDIYLCGVKMAYLSDDIIDNYEVEFLNNLSTKLGSSYSDLKDKYYISYLFEDFSNNRFHSKLAIHKIGAVLLNLIGCDNSVDKREGDWFKKNLNGLDHNLLSDLLSTNVTTLIDGMPDEDKLLCYVLGVEVSLQDQVIHKNETFWLDYIFNSISKNFKMDRDLSFIFFESVTRNEEHISKYYKYFSKVSNFFDDQSIKSWASWKLKCSVLQKKSIPNIFFDKEYELSKAERNEELISLSFSLDLINDKKTLLTSLTSSINEDLFLDTMGEYGEMLICEILKMALLDNHIDTLEENYLRQMQYRFSISEKQLHRVVFMTSFLLGWKVELSTRINYSYL